MSSIVRNVQAFLTPFLFIVWVVCGVVLICQYKGMLPWLEGWSQTLIVLIVIVPPVLLIIYAVIEVLKKYVLQT
ncbi:hypothetical protein [Methanocella arvoryzae]|uniref:hypothetical protein n=1 Tax=Methanocella arvoryzae TaxID=1175445 RepID=UPI0003242B24|nr:hypothetical protein [Methanocella arvoryzae]